MQLSLKRFELDESFFGVNKKQYVTVIIYVISKISLAYAVTIKNKIPQQSLFILLILVFCQTLFL